MSALAAASPKPQGSTERPLAVRCLPIALVGALLVAIQFMLGGSIGDYYFLAGYVIVQYVVLASAWNILGGYAGYVNFGTAGFFAVGAYTTVVLHKLGQPPLVVSMILAGLVTGVLGLLTGYLTLRLRGVFFSIATLALAVVLQTLIVNWSFVGGARGVYLIRPEVSAPFSSYVQMLLIAMTILAVIVVSVAFCVERSWIGLGLAAIRDDELAAEASGVPGLRLKLVATVLSGAAMGMAGAPFPYFVTYIDPPSAFSLAIAVNAIAMPLIGGTITWWGPVIGALLLATVQQILTVTISSAANLLLVGIILVVFVVAAPNGIVGLIANMRKRR
jgi:branched-chain amino acid transport system permease protein